MTVKANTQPNLLIGNRYKLVKELGKGGMGAVYQAQDRLTGNEIALKRVLIPAHQLRFASFRQDSELRELFLSLAQEFRVMASLRHPHINSVLDYGFGTDHQPYFTMELLRDAQPLRRAAWGKSRSTIVGLIIQLLQALSYLHRRGIIHRDLKHGNVLIVNGQVKVLDFGLSFSLDSDQQDPNVVAGTLGYIAPEVLLGKAVTPAADLYAVGVIAYELLTGLSLYSENSTEIIIKETVHKTADLFAIEDGRLRAVVQRLLEKDPLKRYSSAEAAIEAFGIASGLTIEAETRAIRESFLQAARFVGRTSEYNLLLDKLYRAVDNRVGNIQIIGGESGAGKTRLLDEIRTQALVSGAIVIRGQNLAEGNAPYQMWRAPLRMLALSTALEDEEAAILKPLIPDIDELLERPIPDAPEASPAVAQGRLLFTIEQLFKRQTAPLLVILEDLHWAGNESLVVLRRLNEQIDTLALLILGSYRDDERPDLPKTLAGIDTLKLYRLSDDGIVELSIAILGEKGRQPRLINYLKQETEGNAFFLVEVMRALSDKVGQLGNISDMELPEHIFAGGINQIIQHRLSRVPLFAQPLLQTAAVAGRQLDLKVLRSFVDSDVELEDWLTVLNEASVLDVQDNLWRFAHDKLREGVLGTITAEDRVGLHRDVATAISSIHMLRINEFTASLVYHWGAAGDAEKESQYAALAGKQALASGAHQKAVDFSTRALLLMKQELGSEKKQAVLHQTIGEAAIGLEQHALAEQHFEAALAACQAVNYKWGIAAAQNDLGMISALRGNIAAAEGHFKQALTNAMNIRAQAMALTALLGFAGISLTNHRTDTAFEFASFVVQNPATDAKTRERAAQMVNLLSGFMAPEQVATVATQSAQLKLSDLAKHLLE